MEPAKSWNQSVVELIGNTPLLQLNRYAAAHDLDAAILAKLEYRNPARSPMNLFM